MTDKDWVEQVLGFWFGELTQEDWYSGKKEVDERIVSRFGDLPDRLAHELSPDEAADQRTALAAVIALDQFPRNIHRGKAAAFATDDLAIRIARRALDAGLDAGLDNQQRQFLYMPFMHSEVLADQERCVDLFRSLDNEEALKYAIDHRDIIAEYGRFPHRNKALGRQSTEAEKAFLDRHAGFGQ
jgi:uncharacterized protein (DUF924 family)